MREHEINVKQNKTKSLEISFYVLLTVMDIFKVILSPWNIYKIQKCFYLWFHYMLVSVIFLKFYTLSFGLCWFFFFIILRVFLSMPKKETAFRANIVAKGWCHHCWLLSLVFSFFLCCSLLCIFLFPIFSYIHNSFQLLFDNFVSFASAIVLII